MLGDGHAVRSVFPTMQDAAMHLGMKGLHAAVEHFRETSEFGNVFHGDAGVTQQLGGAAGRDKFHAHAGEFSGEIYQSGFVGNAEDGALDFGHEGPRSEGKF